MLKVPDAMAGLDAGSGFGFPAVLVRVSFAHAMGMRQHVAPSGMQFLALVECLVHFGCHRAGFHCFDGCFYWRPSRVPTELSERECGLTSGAQVWPAVFPWQFAPPVISCIGVIFLVPFFVLVT